MADPFTGLAEGIQKGMTLGLASRQAKTAEAEAKRKQQDSEFDRDVGTIKANADVMSKDIPIELKQAAANNMLSVYRRQAERLGLDPSQVPSSFDYSKDRDTPFLKELAALTDAYERKIIGKNDFRLGLFGVGKRWNDTIGKAPDIAKLGENMIDDTTKPRGKMEVQMGPEKVAIQETEPGSGDYTPIKVDGKTASAPVAAPSEQTNAIQEATGQLDSLNNIEKLYDPKYVGMADDVVGKVRSKTGGISEDEAMFRASVKKYRTEARKFFLGTAQSKQELEGMMEAIPDTNQSDTQFEAAVDETRRNIRSMLKRKTSLSRTAGYATPSDEEIATLSNEELVNHKFGEKKKEPKKKGKTLDDPSYWR